MILFATTVSQGLSHVDKETLCGFRSVPPSIVLSWPKIRAVMLMSEPTSEGMIERCVVVQRQSDGYGFTVTGDHPVFVHTVKPDGAAFCAGVREGDRILKVRI
ncbi:hypothetical protein OSTOST_01236 [Ostertagia ostertagi]